MLIADEGTVTPHRTPGRNRVNAMSYVKPNQKKLEISQLYLDLASECFNQAAKTERTNDAEALRQMGRRYVSEASVLDPSVSRGEPSSG
jgi:hypothetical protein